jgi:hypothetical protein
MTINTGEPTHLDSESVERPAPADLKSTITPTKIADVQASVDAFYKDADKRQAFSSQNPNINGGPFSPLHSLIFDALREYGESNPGSMIADVSTLFLKFSNKIIEDLRAHPYFDIPDLDYYTSIDEVRTIPDIIMTDGLLHYYALQQLSIKSKLYEPAYYRRVSTVLFQRKYGNAKIEIEPRK